MSNHWWTKESCECRECNQKRIADLRAENKRLREENERLREEVKDLQSVIRSYQKAVESALTELADQTGASIIAREALEGGDDE